MKTVKVVFPELEKIKKLCESMEKRVQKVEEKIEKRITYFESKSLSWQASERGEEYMEHTEHLEFCSEVAQERIQSILDEIEDLESQTE